MTLLVLGILLWCVVHLIPTLGKGLKSFLIERLGDSAYRGLFSLAIIASLVMIIYGWRTTEPINIYVPPQWGVHANNVFMLWALFLFVASQMPTRLRRSVRHPMLSGVTIWGSAHILANGDQRSMIVFGALTFWSVLEMILINVRDGEWISEEEVSLQNDLIAFAVTVVVFFVITFLHKLVGVSPFPFI